MQKVRTQILYILGDVLPTKVTLPKFFICLICSCCLINAAKLNIFLFFPVYLCSKAVVHLTFEFEFRLMQIYAWVWCYYYYVVLLLNLTRLLYRYI